MLKRNWFSFFTAVILISVLCLSGCGNEGTDTKKDNTVTFTDALGKSVSVEKNPKRVAALLGSFADVWVLSGGEVCATADDAWDDFGLELPDAVNLGGAHSPSLETLISANPDFVIASASTAANVDMKDALENAGITVAYFDVDCFEDYLNMLDICTDITGRKDLFEKNGLDIQKKIEEIKADFESQDIPSEQKKVLLLRASASSVKAKGSFGTVLGEMLYDLGCENISDSDESLLESLSVESIISKNPYHIFVVTMGEDTQNALDNFYRITEENPAFGTLEAVKENRVHVMDRRLFNLKPNADWAEAYEELSETLLGRK